MQASCRKKSIQNENDIIQGIQRNRMWFYEFERIARRVTLVIMMVGLVFGIACAILGIANSASYAELPKEEVSIMQDRVSGEYYAPLSERQRSSYFYMLNMDSLAQTEGDDFPLMIIAADDPKNPIATDENGVYSLEKDRDYLLIAEFPKDVYQNESSDPFPFALTVLYPDKLVNWESRPILLSLCDNRDGEKDVILNAAVKVKAEGTKALVVRREFKEYQPGYAFRWTDPGFANQKYCYTFFQLSDDGDDGFWLDLRLDSIPLESNRMIYLRSTPSGPSHNVQYPSHRYTYYQDNEEHDLVTLAPSRKVKKAILEAYQDRETS